MKDPSRRTKVVIRHLPPSYSQSDFVAQFLDRFSDRYNWFCFRPGKSSHKHQRYSRAYLNLRSPEDVIEFAELLNGHCFVNEKGAQFKALVEYAPSQRVPKPSTKKDNREGTISKDPDYLEFLKLIAKPAEHLPSAEIQLERKEAELSGATKEPPIVTPLMEYVRNKRAAESGAQVSLAVGKVGRRSRATGKSGPSATKRGSEKKKYILKDSAKHTSRKDKSSFVSASWQEDQPTSASTKEMSEIEAICGVEGSVSGITLTSGSGKKKILLLKGKERDASKASDAPSHLETEATPAESKTTTARKQVQKCEAGGRLIRSMLLNNEGCQSQFSTGVHPEQKMLTLSSETGNRPPRPINLTLGSNGDASKDDSPLVGSDNNIKRGPDDRLMRKDLLSSGTMNGTQEKHARNKDRPDRGVWAPLRRSDFSAATGQASHLPSETVEVTQGDVKDNISHESKIAEVTAPSGVCNSMKNGSHRHYIRRATSHRVADNGSLILNEGKSKRRGAISWGAPEKQVWIQKSSSGS